MPSKRTLATNITPEARRTVLIRDSVFGTPLCIFCGQPYGLQIAHFVARSSGGMGIPQNLACVCYKCHDRLDHTMNRKDMLETFEKHLKRFYKDWNREELIYRK